VSSVSVVPYDTPERRRWVELMRPAAELANAVAGTDFVPTQIRNNPGAIAAAILYGDEIGLGPMNSLAKIAVVNGRPTLAAEAMRSLVLQAGHDLWIEESTISKVTVAGRRRDSQQTSKVTWTLDDAKRAGLAGKPNWRAYPRQMLLARASAELARLIFADAIGGLTATEEIEADLEATDAADVAEKPKGQRRKRDTTTLTASTRATPKEEEAAPPLPPLPDEPGYSAGEPEPLASEQQKRRMFALFRERGMQDRGERLAWASDLLGRELKSSNELTVSEASRLMEALEQQQAAPPASAAQQAHLSVLVSELAAANLIDGDDLHRKIAELRDVDPGEGRLKWAMLRDTLTQDEAGELIDWLEAKAGRGQQSVEGDIDWGGYGE
jgi:hypothetical protein